MQMINGRHEYAMSLLAWIVKEPINGRTDYYVTAAFESEWEANQYAEWLNQRDPERDFDYEVDHVGTMQHATS